jgi:DNA-binding beta-propeller fold protein YncE
VCTSDSEEKEFMMKNLLLAFAAIALVSVLLTGVMNGADAPGYHVIATYKLGGEGGWDYLTMDSASGRLYISRGTHVAVIDAGNGKVLGDIADTSGVHGIALAPDMNMGFTSNGREGTVSIVDLKTFQTTGKVKVGDNPDAIVYDPATKHVFTMNGRSHDASVVDPAKKQVLGTIKLDGKPEFAVSDGKGKIWVNIEDKNEVTELDANQMKVLRSWPLSNCEAPSGLSMDMKHRRLFSGCSDNKTMAISDADAGKTIANLPICEGTDATAFDPGSDMAFASCHDGHITVVKEDSPDKFHVAETVTTEEGARTMTIDPKTHKLYTVTAKIGPRPQPTADNPHPRPAIMPDSFVVLVVGK